MELITKKAVKVGNSAGVLLPVAWLNGIVEIKLISLPPNKEEIINQLFSVLKNKLLDIKSLAIVGSYARDEEESQSDVDVIAITEKEEAHLKIGKFDVLFLTEKKIEEDLKKNALPILPMLREAKPIININLIKKYSCYPVTKNNLKWHIETTKSAIELAKESLDVAKDTGKLAGRAVAYSLILRLRSLYLIDCLIKNKKWTNKEFNNLVKKITGSKVAYEDYLNVKNNKNKKSGLRIDEAEKLIDYLENGLSRIEETLNKYGKKKKKTDKTN